ncbi:hypothetical protein BX264_4217 [Streptomyces sp. 2333.5]|uniref:DUF4175 domain-containing protein n=1 Tax=Streptomyces TaxID=1883 RepID=UPI0008956F7B|nr:MULTISPECIES: DUF4175 domain-containing protein [unclassified Streptomyces]PJJ03816.1 hypothetical protein BX264_4217 [Streptomyces sp. 2333.5]SEE32502.1 hypothetical protein SAMN05428943_4389 [Streptomyces sp. 2314.4]SEE59279.1 hypothetical protein SAMN05428942_4317 [Streptomyces sp. 2112.2]SOE11802.1 hypothetical protein SAMN06272775_2785 [Streptomyces sp. 2323.1]
MTFHSGDLTYRVLARSHHHYHHYSGGTGDGAIDWWVWPLLALSAIVVIWSLVKRFRSN